MINITTIRITETGTVTEPVSLTELKNFMKVDYTDEDTIITAMGISARQDIERLMQVKLVPSTVSMYMNTSKCDEELPVLPWAMSLSQVTALTVNLVQDGEANELQVIDEDYYFNGSLKISSASRNLVQYTVTPVVPQTIKEAIMMLVAYRYNNRGDQSEQKGVPEDIYSKISTFAQVWL
jgi:uncharacterized phiE125 gp8 family phage protein